MSNNYNILYKVDSITKIINESGVQGKCTYWTINWEKVRSLILYLLTLILLIKQTIGLGLCK